MAIAVGQMDRIIYVKRFAYSRDNYGGTSSSTYTQTTTPIFAQVVWKGGKINEEGKQMQNNQIVEFYTRNGGDMATVDVTDRIVYDNTDYFIDVINVVDGREKYIQIITTQVAAIDAPL